MPASPIAREASEADGRDGVQDDANDANDWPTGNFVLSCVTIDYVTKNEKETGAQQVSASQRAKANRR
jgi:hypothetical protein